MNGAVTQKQLSDLQMNVAVVRPVIIWGPPGVANYAFLLPECHSLPFSPRGNVFRIR